ncbi:LuxR family transcriptional regulator [Sphingomonas sp. BGYR3]|uniref:helix-turn-helix transcriptional regulator n=1 Tax=Sphingomonas sp. BGYR3 TaxID=2975483 RepID=UPI0021A37303|nr:LuxR family transcriptional regulator [Sphingomonas sp. BGYR3]MDG5489040.1 LuxR family transcriptional regulator [Sphingomonas sp. BGYR3]
MASWIDRITGANRITRVLDLCREEILARGAAMISYHFAAAFGSQTGDKVILSQFGFPEPWIERYRDPDFRRHDPVTEFIMQAGRPMRWDAATAAQTLNADQQAFLDAFRALGVPAGVGIPLFGPNGRDAYCGIGFDRDLVPGDRMMIGRMVAIAQMGHRRVVELLTDRGEEPVRVSARESEVLHWMARGKSNADIAVILGLSPATVDTFVRRLYDKLGVNDRISAIVRALSEGLVRV